MIVNTLNILVKLYILDVFRVPAIPLKVFHNSQSQASKRSKN